MPKHSTALARHSSTVYLRSLPRPSYNRRCSRHQMKSLLLPNFETNRHPLAQSTNIVRIGSKAQADEELTILGSIFEPRGD